MIKYKYICNEQTISNRWYKESGINEFMFFVQKKETVNDEQVGI